MQKISKILMWLLVFSLVIGLVPMFAPVTVSEAGFLKQDTAPIPNNAIIISTAQQLSEIGGDTAEAYYVLANDINLVSEWTPINNFAGTFDGRGFSINGLYVFESSNRQNAGLFGQINANNVTIKNVAVNIAPQGVFANYMAGGLVGSVGGPNDGATVNTFTIENCYTTGNVSVDGYVGYAGGLIGFIRGNTVTIKNCYTTGKISSSSASLYSGECFVGGLIGVTYEGTVTIENCYATGEISINLPANSVAGGLVGSFVSSGTLRRCYATGNISVVSSNSNSNAGGLVGTTGISSAIFTIEDSYARGNIFAVAHSIAWAGGLIGHTNVTAATIRNCYATGNVSASGSYSSVGNMAGGLIAQATGTATVTNCYRLSTQTVTGNTINTDGTPLTSSQMTSASNFDGWDFNTIWDIDSGINDGYPFFRQVSNTVSYTVTFKDHDGATITSMSVDHGQAATAPANPTRTGYTFTGWDVAFDNVTSDLVVTAQYTLQPPPTGGGGGTGGTGSGSGTESGNSNDNAPNVNYTQEGDTVTVTNNNNAQNLLEDGNVVVDISGLESAEAVRLPNNLLNGIRQGQGLVIAFPEGNISFSSTAAANMISDGTGGGIVVSMRSPELSPEQSEAVGDSPVVELLARDFNNRPISNFRANVTVSLPYELKPGENPNAIVVYYVAADGDLRMMQGHYDALAEAVVFTTTHFSMFMIAHNPVEYADVTQGWYKDAIDFIAAREYPVGVIGDMFEPHRAVTRGEFTATLMTAYGLELDLTAADNFEDVDANAAYAPHLATAKKLGMITGVGGNLFAPEREITREEMFVLLFRILVSINEMPAESAGNVKTLSDFTDADSIAPWAKEEFEALLRAGMIDGAGNDRLLPKTTSDRASMAQMIFNLQTR